MGKFSPSMMDTLGSLPCFQTPERVVLLDGYLPTSVAVVSPSKAKSVCSLSVWYVENKKNGTVSDQKAGKREKRGQTFNTNVVNIISFNNDHKERGWSSLGGK